MINEQAFKYLTELAQSYVDVDEELKEELSERAEEIENSLTLKSTYELLCEGAMMFKRRALIRAYEEARDAAEKV